MNTHNDFLNDAVDRTEKIPCGGWAGKWSCQLDKKGSKFFQPQKYLVRKNYCRTYEERKDGVLHIKYFVMR